MRILVTGGTGVIGAGVVPALLDRGHSVRLLSRHAAEDAAQWPNVEAFSGDVSDASSVRGAAAGCDAVTHVAGISHEQPPEVTFEKVNVSGTANVLAEAVNAAVKRFVFVSSLGAERGSSAYHQSKRSAESLVRSSAVPWTIVRPGGVYGPGDEVVSFILKMARALPVVPVVGSGDQEFQQLWFRDLGAGVAAVIDRDDLVERTLELAGREVTSMSELLEQIESITGRSVVRLPVPQAAAVAAVHVLPGQFPIDEAKLKMLEEGSVVRGRNDLIETLGIEPTPLEQGLRELADLLPEQQPSDGVGKLQHKTYSALIGRTTLDATGVMELVSRRFSDVMPLEFDAERRDPEILEEGATLTGALPLRGHIQVRVERVEPRSILLATVEGHPLAGTVELRAADDVSGVRFTIDIYARSANLFDLLVMRTVGAVAQDANWRSVIRAVAEAAGGTIDGIDHESTSLDEAEAEAREELVRKIVQRRMRNAHAETGMASR